MQDLLADNSRLVAEVNALRAQAGCAGMAPCIPRPVTEPMTQLMSVKDEVYGRFPAGFGDNWAYQNTPTGSDDPGMGLPLDDLLGLPPHYDPKQYAHNEPVVLGNDLSLDGFPADYHMHNSMGSNSSIASQSGTSTLYPGFSLPVSPPGDNHIPVDVPGHFDDSLVAAIHTSTTWPPAIDNGLDWSCDLDAQPLDNEYRQAVH